MLVRVMDVIGRGSTSEKSSRCARIACGKFFSGLNNTICRLIHVKLENKVLIESQLLSCVCYLAVSDTQLSFLLCQQIIVNMSLFTSS